MKVMIVDYGMGNLWSVKHAFEFLGCDCSISSNPKVIENSDRIVLPGVGAFGEAMNAINERCLADPLREAILAKKRNLLGICLGMQLLAEDSEESFGAEGLGFVKGHVVRFSKQTTINQRIPHVGFNDIEVLSTDNLFRGFQQNADFYFVHSFHLQLKEKQECLATCEYGQKFTAAIQKENIFATQFHPEKSQTNGLKMLKNFLAA